MTKPDRAESRELYDRSMRVLQELNAGKAVTSEPVDPANRTGTGRDDDSRRGQVDATPGSAELPKDREEAPGSSGPDVAVILARWDGKFASHKNMVLGGVLGGMLTITIGSVLAVWAIVKDSAADVKDATRHDVAAIRAETIRDTDRLQQSIDRVTVRVERLERRLK